MTRRTLICFVLILGIAGTGVQAGPRLAHLVCGYVEDAIDCMDSAWHTARIYYPDDLTDWHSCPVNAETDYFCCNVEVFRPDWQIGDEVYAEIVDNGDGYTAGPVSVTLTGSGFDVAPTMQIHKDGITQHEGPCLDEDADFINDFNDNCLGLYNPYQHDDDGDGVGNECDVCSTVPAPGGSDADGRPLGDLDDDCGIDLNDFATFAICYTGAGVPPTPDCQVSDLDIDNDVDLNDFATFALNFTG